MEAVKNFVVRYARAVFFTRRLNGVALGSLYPSQGLVMTYPVAFALAQALREEGFPDAVVCNPNGLPASVADIHKATQAADVRDSEEFAAIWDEAVGVEK